MRITNSKLDDFQYAYIECALWSSTDDNDEPLDGLYTRDDFDSESLQTMMDDCARFFDQYSHLFEGWEARAGHDFWLTRNRHGAGFWDRPEIYGKDASKTLTDASHWEGSCDLYIGDDGRIYCV